MKNQHHLLILVVAVSALSLGCSADAVGVGGELSVPSSVNVSQGGAQDFAEFRAIVEEGGVPSPDTLDETGFFAEHAVDLPAADCGDALCLHPMLAVAPRFGPGAWTMAFVAMNTAIDAKELVRPPLHLVLAVEKRWSVLKWLPSNGTAITNLIDELKSGDRVTVIGFDHASRVLGAVTRDEPNASSTVLYSVLGSIGSVDHIPEQEYTSIYEGLAAADRAIEEVRETFDGAHRVLLFTTARADTGITDEGHIVGLAESMIAKGTAIGMVGIGEEYDGEMARAIGSLGGGNLSYARDAEDLGPILELEAKTTLFPLATNFELQLTSNAPYDIGRVYGVSRATTVGNTARLSLPALFIGRREGADDALGGRRGGGGGLFVELLPKEASVNDAAGEAAFVMTASWKTSEDEVEQTSTTIVNELAPGLPPDGMWPSFSHPGHGKPFMMLNMYLALHHAVKYYAEGDCARAMGLIDMMMPSVEGWQAKFNDADFAEDYRIMLKLRANLVEHCNSKGVITPRPPNTAPACFLL
ncbi:MAG: hypothetical protein VB934_17255 [Polyangiaceae bacterium]